MLPDPPGTSRDPPVPESRVPGSSTSNGHEMGQISSIFDDISRRKSCIRGGTFYIGFRSRGRRFPAKNCEKLENLGKWSRDLPGPTRSPGPRFPGSRVPGVPGFRGPGRARPSPALPAPPSDPCIGGDPGPRGPRGPRETGSRGPGGSGKVPGTFSEFFMVFRIVWQETDVPET